MKQVLREDCEAGINAKINAGHNALKRGIMST